MARKYTLPRVINLKLATHKRARRPTTGFTCELYGLANVSTSGSTRTRAEAETAHTIAVLRPMPCVLATIFETK